MPDLRPIAALVLFGAAAAALAAGEPAPPDNPHGRLDDTCSTCHGPDAWRPAKIAPSFDHGRFRFPLEGSHRQTSCRSCHASLVFAEAPQDCIACHQDAHRGELGTDCSRCHTPTSFLDRQRMRRWHQTTRFLLTGAHAGADCEACHTLHGNQIWVNTPTDCASCHLKDYNATRNPDHTAAGFPQTCQNCHTTVAFRPARFGSHDATFFPIYSGRHRGTWSACADCHTNPSTFSTFSCFAGCHTHADSAEVGSQHTGVSGYVYDSAACYGCHPSP